MGAGGGGLYREDDFDVSHLGWERGARCDSPTALEQDSRFIYIGCNMRGAPHAAWLHTAGAHKRGSVIMKMRKGSWRVEVSTALPAPDAGVSAMTLRAGGD